MLNLGKRKILLLIVIAVISCVLTVGVFATSTEGLVSSYSIYGYNYEAKSVMDIFYAGTYYAMAASTARCLNSNVPAGYMGTQAHLMNPSNGVVIVYSSIRYSSGTEIQAQISLIGPPSGTNYYSEGHARFWNGSGYWNYGLYPSPVLTVP